MTNDNGNNNIPPGRIVDLKADLIQIQINEDDPIHGIYLTFTAPGGDLDDGKGIFDHFQMLPI